MDLLVSYYAGKSKLTLHIQMNYIDWVMEMDPLAPDYTGDSRLTFLHKNQIDWVMQVDP